MVALREPVRESVRESIAWRTHTHLRPLAPRRPRRTIPLAVLLADARERPRDLALPLTSDPRQVETSDRTRLVEEASEPWSAARWRREWGKVATFIGVLLLLEAANGYLLAAAFAWVLPGNALPILASLALIVVLIGTVLSRSLLANPVLQSHKLRLRVTLVGLIALQFAVNTIQGYSVAQAHLPGSAADFFQLNPALAARLIGAVLGGSLALITFSYLLLVAQILEEMLPPPNLQREAEVLLRRYEHSGPPPSHPVSMAQPAPAGLTATAQASRDDQTMPATRFWPHLKR